MAYKETIVAQATENSPHELVNKNVFAGQLAAVSSQSETEIANQIQELFTPASFAQLGIDAGLFAATNELPNTNGIFYWKVTAQEVGGETLIRLYDRVSGSQLIASKYCPLGVASILLQVCCIAQNYYSAEMEYGFNADNQNFYAIKINGNKTITNARGEDTSWETNVNVMVMTLEVKREIGNTTETTLGEFFVSGTYTPSDIKNAPALAIISTPIPA